MNKLNHSRTLPARLFAATLLLASAGTALAGVHFVDVNSASPAPPYTSWASAAAIIQDAVDAAVADDEIVVLAAELLGACSTTACWAATGLMTAAGRGDVP